MESIGRRRRAWLRLGRVRDFYYGSALAMTKRRPAKRPDVVAKVDVHQEHSGVLGGISRTVKLASGILLTIAVFSGASFWFLEHFESVAHASEKRAEAKKEMDEHKEADKKNLAAMQQGFDLARLYGDKRQLLADKRAVELRLSDSQARQMLKIKEDPVGAVIRKRDENDLQRIEREITAIDVLINAMKLKKE